MEEQKPLGWSEEGSRQVGNGDKVEKQRRETDGEQRPHEKEKESRRKGGNMKRMRSSWNWISGLRIKGRGAIGAEDSFMAPQAKCTLPSLCYSQDGHCWRCRSLCTFEGQQKTREISEKSQVTLQRLT